MWFFYEAVYFMTLVTFTNWRWFMFLWGSKKLTSILTVKHVYIFSSPQTNKKIRILLNLSYILFWTYQITCRHVLPLFRHINVPWWVYTLPFSDLSFYSIADALRFWIALAALHFLANAIYVTFKLPHRCTFHIYSPSYCNSFIFLVAFINFVYFLFSSPRIFLSHITYFTTMCLFAISDTDDTLRVFHTYA